ncbi:helix-turn-helix transcriptional regulator [Rhizobium sp. 16-488-2a]|nr:helix-turn-helix transcriptional regulator [Rhizobium sp. 16-488-2b]MBO9176068.1 helix-turn-helix transcriptional regulator [Rhizobium sp. 16-488-2a]
MHMKQWRQQQGLTMEEAAALLQVEYAGSYQRYETGENRPDAPMAERIRLVSGGVVTLEDLHQQRLEWLKIRRPEMLTLFPEVREAAP